MTDNEKEKAWKEYKETQSSEIREKLIIEYARLVKIVAGKMSIHFNGMLDVEDLYSYGVFGLIDAIDKFELDKGVKFETYASLRIRGEILDNVRKLDWIPRTIRQKQKDITKVSEQFQMVNGRKPSDEELMDELNMDEDRYYTVLGQIETTNMLYMDDDSEESNSALRTIKQSSFVLPEDSVIRDELKSKIMESLEKLTEREKKVILLYYYEELTVKEIASILDVTESRISQLHTKALLKMKAVLGEYSNTIFNI